MNLSFRRLLLPALLLVLATGCSLTLDATKLGVPARLSSAAGTPPEGERFSVTSRAVYGLWGAFKISDPKIQKQLAAQLVDGKEIADVKIKVRSKFSDLLITGLTLGLIVPRAVTVEGVVVDK